jgi:outer membrane receptor protein involved in Fe transport
VLAGTAIDNAAIGQVASYEGTGVDTAAIFSLDPRIGLLYRPFPWISLKANAGRYLRPPTLPELFGDAGSVQGNDALKPESGTQADVGFRLVPSPSGRASVTLDADAFWLVSDDRIVLVQNSQASLYPVNFGKTWVQGVESAIDLSLGGWFDNAASLTWQLSRNITEGSSNANKELPRTPSLELWWSPSLHWGERVRAGYSFSYTAPNYWDAANLYLSAPRMVHGAFLKARPTPRWPEVELDCLNLTDTITQVLPRNPADPTDTSELVAAVTDFSAYPLPGRTFLGSVRWDF